MAPEGLNSPPSKSRPSSPRSSLTHLPTSPAARRVADYLRALGLRDRGCLQELSVQIAGSITGRTADEHARRAVAEAQRRFEAWRDELYRVLPKNVSPLWLKEFIGTHPHLFLVDVVRAQAAAQTFGDPVAGRGPPRARFRTQHLDPVLVPRWLLGLTLPLLATSLAAYGLWRELRQDGTHVLEPVWVALFAFLFLMIALGSWTSVLGFFGRRTPSAAGTDAGLREPLPKSALIVPIYHENAEEVFAAIEAMRESLAALPEASSFEVFVLSDSRDPELCAEEEGAFRSIASRSKSVPVYYHRRARNDRQKAGNVAEFFESWGPRYTYVVVLDADSLMSGETLVSLIRQMEAEPHTALLQAPISLFGAETLFGRSLQFASSVCGPLFTRGLARWSGPHGNYYGHNAVIRVQAFMACCALPKLKGNPPLGGDVLSHDFVEAALLCRADWQVRMAHELSAGSYEGVPPTLTEYIARDRRWCQGNLQHLLIAGSHGFKPMSRVHLLLGAFAYLASPVWLVFLALAAVLWHQNEGGYERVGPLVLGATLALLMTPWLLGFMATVRDRQRRSTHGGWLALVASTLLSLVVGALLAPILMLHHTRIVLSVLTGHTVRWGAQRRRAGLAGIPREELLTTLVGAAVALGLWLSSNGLLWWLAPIWVPWVLSIPISLVVSSPRVGAFFRRIGLLVTPPEKQPEPLLARADELRSLTRLDACTRYRDLVLDPVLIATHLERLGGKRAPVSAKLLKQLTRRALCDGPASLTLEEWHLLMQDSPSMQRLHRQAWQRWSVESWGRAREQPSVPNDDSGSGITLGNPPKTVPTSAIQANSEPVVLRSARTRRRMQSSRSG